MKNKIKKNKKKNEKLVKEAAKFKKPINNEEEKQSEPNIISRKIKASNPAPFSESGNITEDEANQKITLLQNLYNEEKNEVQKLKTTIEELEQKKLETELNKIRIKAMRRNSVYFDRKNFGNKSIESSSSNTYVNKILNDNKSSIERKRKRSRKRGRKKD